MYLFLNFNTWIRIRVLKQCKRSGSRYPLVMASHSLLPRHHSGRLPLWPGPCAEGLAEKLPHPADPRGGILQTQNCHGRSSRQEKT